MLFLNEVLKSEHSHFPESHRGQPIFKGKAIRLYLWLAGASKDLQTCFTASTGWRGSLAYLYLLNKGDKNATQAFGDLSIRYKLIKLLVEF